MEKGKKIAEKPRVWKAVRNSGLLFSQPLVLDIYRLCGEEPRLMPRSGAGWRSGAPRMA